MKRFLVKYGVLWIVVFAIPMIMVAIRGEEVPIFTVPNKDEVPVSEIDAQVEITLNNNGNVEKIKLDEYLVGVVAAEMPALFPEEALKAQAIAARTYTMKKVASKPDANHGGASVCNDPSHCKAYKPISEFAASWNTASEEYTSKIKNAVAETDGVIMLYDGEPITAVFHSTSSGKTENSADVWGSAVPYLVSVESKGDAESPHYEEVKSFTPDEFRLKFSEKHNDAKFDVNPENWITNISRSDAGGIKNIAIGGVSLKGSEVRSIYGLKSANFTIAYENGMIIIKTKGYGHGVGMSQYGARAMALEGKSYDEILKSYYTGITLGKIRQKSTSQNQEDMI